MTTQNTTLNTEAANDSVTNLCSRRLWEILQLSKLKNINVAAELVMRIEEELAEREHQELYVVNGEVEDIPA